MGNEKFRLLEVYFGNDDILKNLHLKFVDEGDSDDGSVPYTTVLIGLNGAGKSQTMRGIIEVFRDVVSIAEKGERLTTKRLEYWIKYAYGGKEYVVNTIEDKELNKLAPSYLCSGDGKPINWDELKVPQRMISTSVLLNDRFLFMKEGADKFYHYEGVRSAPNRASTLSQTKKTMFGMLTILSEEGSFDKLRSIFHIINYEEWCQLIFYPRYRETFFSGNLNLKKFHDHFSGLESPTLRTTKSYAISPYNKIKDNIEIVNRIVELLKKITLSLQRIEKKNSRATHFVYDVFSSILTPDELNLIPLINELDLLTLVSVNVRKKGNNKATYSIEKASSGEYNVFVSLLGIANKIQSQSLILIDEPEVSLHPNWQMRYLDFLKSMFQNYPGCHFIIATHSHFIVSDLKGENSSIVHMYNNDGKISAKPFERGTYGWSAEDVLYNVFDVVTTRNSYVADEIGAILDRLSKGDTNKENILDRPTYDKLLYLQKSLKENDPLKTVVNSILNHIEV